MINQSFCLCLNQKPCSSVGQPGPLDSRRGVGEVFNFLLLLIGPLTFPLEGGDYTIPPFYLRKLTRNDMNICCGAPSLCKASLEFITQYLNSLILYLMRGWMRIISFKPEIIFLWGLFFSTFNFRILHFILSPVVLAGPHLTPVSDLFMSSTVEDVSHRWSSQPVCMCTCVIVEVCIYEAIWPYRKKAA